MSIASRQRQDMKQKARYRRTTRVPESERGQMVWKSRNYGGVHFMFRSMNQGTYHRTTPRPGAKCPCGSGKAHKRCCGKT